MSKTPRIDEHLRMKEENGHVVIVSRDFARQLETELIDKEKQLAEARAEIEALKNISLSSMINARKLSSAELKAAQRLRKESSPEALESERAANAQLTEELERKDKLIERMRQALEEIVACGRADSEDAQEVVIAKAALEVVIAKAALEAAERGE